MQQVLPFVAAFALSLALTPVMRWVARRTGAVAYPNSRSVHRYPIPYLGGVAIFAASVAAVVVSGFRDGPSWRALLLGGLFILVVGLIDDLITLKPWQKLIGQVISGAIVVAAGIRISFITNPVSGEIHLLPDWIAVGFTVFWVVSFENLINLSDGLDGLAAGVVGIASTVMTLSAVRSGNAGVVPQALAIAGAVAGFLPYNFHPARIFMGDAGAMYLGLALACISAEGLVKSTAAMALLAPILALLVPISDAAFAIVRRRLAGQPVSRADHDHIHHRLLEMGLSHRQVVLLIYGVSVLLGGLGLFSSLVPVEMGAPAAIIGVSALYLICWRFGLFSLKGLYDKQKLGDKGRPSSR
ncbi:MAG TPA: undecaprenyl/decaprenyl-phosphate alpha-N-acetylglucosaminyl 1-phosphate transferase [Firmicutes bacterium]|nr:undecaprenyl/decaprenyl-phosphate alpha-N-acetylglucosaminyl 1-phosphate transferase [Candidatus Fermentithermobacillaceae bacterium]